MSTGPWLDAVTAARRGGVWRGELPLAAFSRLSSVVGSRDGAGVTVELSFEVDPNGRVRVAGECRLPAAVTCARCFEDEAVDVCAAVDARLVASDADARELIAEHDVIVVPGREIELAALVEDDLLLAVPEVACGSRDPCPNAPELRYPAADEEAAVRRGPFDVLAALRGGGSGEDR